MISIAPPLQFEGLNLARLLADRAKARPEQPFLIWAPHEGAHETWTYQRFATTVARLAGGLAARGVQPGDRVVVQLENCPELLLTLLACAHLGAICVPLNAMAVGPELSYYVEAVQAVGAVTQPSFAQPLQALQGSLKWVVVTGHDGGRPSASESQAPASNSFASLLGDQTPVPSIDAASPLLVLFTSGTTSRPKGVLWTHANALWAARLGAQQQRFCQSDVMQSFLPLCHVVGLSWSVLPMLWVGGTVVLQPRFSASRFWPVALQYRCTVASQVIFTANVLMNQPVPEHHFRQWCNALWLPEQERTFGVSMLGAWGMTEMTAQGIVSEPGLPPLPGGIGRPSVGYEVRVEDDAGRACRPGEMGHLLVKGIPGVTIFSRYWNDPVATGKAFDERGYFITGDTVRVQEDGSIRFSDRQKDFLKVGGEGVSAAEIERVVRSVPGVSEVAVVGKPDPLYGEVPVAFVIGSREVQELRSAIIDTCTSQLSKFKVPREVRVIGDFPRISIGKVSKAQLREMAKIPDAEQGEAPAPT